MRKLVLIGNCQVEGLRKHLLNLIPETEIVAHEVWRMTPADIEGAGTSLHDADAIIAQPLHAPQYGELRIDALKSCQGKFQLHFIHNLHFEGAMPDCTYVGQMGKRIASPISGYHSRIVLQSYLDGIDELSCLARLKSGHGVDAVKIWGQQIDELNRRESLVTIPFAAEVGQLTLRQRSFHVINHPNGTTLGSYALKIAEAVQGHKIQTVQPAIDHLESGGGWPTYEWVSRSLGLPYIQEYFLTPGTIQKQISLAEFIHESYKIYSRQPASDLVT